MESNDSNSKRVCVIGAGSSGLTAIKACLEEGQRPVCFERGLDIGGLWNYSAHLSAPGWASIYDSLVINTCKQMMSFSDFPVPESFPQFLTHKNVKRYFRMYADHFGLMPYVCFNTEVRHIKKANNYYETGAWIVTYVIHGHDNCKNDCICSAEIADCMKQLKSTKQIFYARYNNGIGRRNTDNANCQDAAYDVTEIFSRASSAKNDSRCSIFSEEFSGVMVCTGHHCIPYQPDINDIDKFKGQIIHSRDYKRPNQYVDKNVLVVGIGNSAVDIAADLAKSARKVYLSTRRGAWLLGRTAAWGMPADMLANSRIMTRIPSSLLQWIFELACNWRVDHKEVGLSPKHRLLEAHPTINDELPFHILTGRVVVRANIKRVFECHVLFEDGVLEEIDDIILATGYDYCFSFLDPNDVNVVDNAVNLYKYVFPSHLPHATLAIIGLVQPIGAFMPIAELQCRWFVNLLIGRVKLPTRDVMEKHIEHRLIKQQCQYYPARRHTLQVPWITCMDETASEIGAKPRQWQLFFQDFYLWWRCLMGPCIPAQYRLFGPCPWSKASDFIMNSTKLTALSTSAQLDSFSAQRGVRFNNDNNGKFNDKYNAEKQSSINGSNKYLQFSLKCNWSFQKTVSKLLVRDTIGFDWWKERITWIILIVSGFLIYFLMLSIAWYRC